MSSDNGIYVLSTSVKNKAMQREYRVAYGAAIDNIGYYPENTRMYDAMLVSYFGNSQIFANRDDALREAFRQSQHMAQTEYGICEIPHLPHAFPAMSMTEAQQLLKTPCYKDFSE
jgi:hypothetical protein